jgi:alpha-N-arabinofuranosidase
MRLRDRKNCLLLAACCLLLSLVSPVASAARVQAGATITIDAGKVEGRISPLLYGQFVEFMFEGVKGGLHAELIRNRSFEECSNVTGLSRYWERYPDDRNDDFAMAFKWDDSAAYPVGGQPGDGAPGHSLRVDVREGVIARHGIYQSQIPVRGGVEYRGYLWMKTAGYEGRVAVALEEDQPGGEAYASADVESVSGDWKKYRFRLKPERSDPLAKLAILFYGRGQLWLDKVSLIANDAVGEVRRDVFERAKALRPAFIRWPGGNVAQDYHWTWGVGPRDERVTWVNLSWKNEPEPSDFGTDEFIEFCRNIGAEPSITVNVEGRGATAEEAAGWVEYCNGPATSRYGAMRAAGGHPEPYGVKYWEVGNEIWGDWVRGHSDAETYGRNFNRYYAAMRAVDPSIKLIAVGDNDMKWNRTVLKLAGDTMDYLAIHHYYGTAEMKGDAMNLMARPLFYERFYAEVERAIRELASGRQIRLAINEWNTSLPDARQHSMESALYGARLMNVFERSGERVAMSAVSDLVNGWIGGIIQASRHRVFVTPTYLVNKVYSNRLGAERLAARADGPVFDTSREGRGVPCLDVVVSRSADGEKMFIKAVNVDRARSISAKISVVGANVSEAGEVETVMADTGAANSFSAPDAVTIRQTRISAGRSFTVELPKQSVSVITLNVLKP